MIYILRGPSGCGKTTFAKTINGAKICSADHFFTKDDGTYEFDPSKLGEAHAACLRKYVDAILLRVKGRQFPIIVDNTNLTDTELAPYVRIAQAYDQPFTIKCFWQQYDDHRHLGAFRFLKAIDLMDAPSTFIQFMEAHNG